MKPYGAVIPNRRLEIIQVLSWYDGMGLITQYRNPANGSAVLEMWVDCTEDRSLDRFMQVTLSKERMEDVLNDRVTLRDAFQKSFTVFLIDTTIDEVTTRWVSTKELEDDYFSEQGVYLNHDPISEILDS